MAISLRKHAWEIFHAGLRAVEPDACIKNHLQLTGHILKVGARFYNLNAYKNIYAAGAVADGLTITRAKSLRIDPEVHLSGHNAYGFFKGLNDLVITGPTKTNVMDIMVLLIG